MQKSQSLVLLIMVVCLAGFAILWIGCEEFNYETVEGDTDDDSGAITGERGSIEACVHDFQTKDGVNGVFVELLNNKTGEVLLDTSGNELTTTTNTTDGCIAFSGLPEEEAFVGVRCSREDYKDTVQFYFPNGSKNEEFLIVSNGTASLVAGTLGIDLDPTKGLAAGALYWGDPSDENPIGCSAVEFEPDNPGGIYYFGFDDLPIMSRNITGDEPENGQGTNPLNGLYININSEPVPTFMYSSVGGGTEANLIPRMWPDTVAIANIYFSKTDYAVDPSPDWCTE